MHRDPRTRLPLAGLLIILVAPLASLMVMVPTLFAGGVQRVQNAVPAIISRLVPNPSPHNAGRPAGHPLPGVASAQRPPGAGSAAPSPGSPAVLEGGVPPPSPPSPPSPAVETPPPPVQTPTVAGHSNHGKRRRRRPHQDLS